jgi:hypothetical protein
LCGAFTRQEEFQQADSNKANIQYRSPNSPTKKATDPALLIDRLDKTGVKGHGAGSEDNKLLFAMVAD